MAKSIKNNNRLKKILVTGGAGYIGSTVVRHLLCRGYDVHVLDNLIQGADGVNCFYGYSNYNFIKGDIRDQKLVNEIVGKVDYVAHLAAIVGEYACKKNPDETKINKCTGYKKYCSSFVKK